MLVQEPNHGSQADKTPASSEVLDEHYRNLADDYDEFLHYSDGFVRTLTGEDDRSPRFR